MSLIVDTGVFWKPAALAKLRGKPGVVVPSIVFMERARQLEAGGDMTLEEFAASLRSLRWTIAPFAAKEATRTARLAPMKPDRWEARARDAMIAGYVGDADVLWTFNAKDFRALGLPDRQIVTPEP
jgi:hypothetical protein